MSWLSCEGREFYRLPYEDWVCCTLKGKIIKYILISLIAEFFAITLMALCLDYHKCSPKYIASVLLFFSVIISN
jgi:hypothetical protein